MAKTSRCAHAFVLASLTGLAVGCDSGADAPQGRAPNARQDNDTLLFDVYASADGGVAGESDDGTQDAGLPPSDGQIVGLLAVLTDDEILLGLDAAWRATDPRIHSLGAEIATTRRAALARQLALGIVPEPSQRAADYAQAGVTILQRLHSLPAGPEYDYAYLQLQIMLDAIAINEVDKQWLANAQSPELQAELAKTRDEMKVDLDRE